MQKEKHDLYAVAHPRALQRVWRAKLFPVIVTINSDNKYDSKNKVYVDTRSVMYSFHTIELAV